MRIQVSPITGVMLGFEFVYDEETEINYFILDLLILRFLISRNGE